MQSAHFLLLTTITSLSAQTPPTSAVFTQLPPEAQGQLDQLLKASDWPAVVDFIETLTPRQRGGLLETWLRALNKSGRFERLLEVCEAAIPQMDGTKGPRLTTARIFRAQALMGLERKPEAMAAYAECGRLGYQLGFENACSLAQSLRDWDSLLEHATSLTNKSPGFGLGPSLRGEALTEQMKFTEAEPVLKEAVKLPGHTAMAWADLACCLVERQAYSEAIDAASRALTMEPANLVALYNRGRARFGLKQYQEGRQDLIAAQATGKADKALAQNLQQNIELADRFLAFRKKLPKSSAK